MERKQQQGWPVNPRTSESEKERERERERDEGCLSPQGGLLRLHFHRFLLCLPCPGHVFEQPGQNMHRVSIGRTGMACPLSHQDLTCP